MICCIDSNTFIWGIKGQGDKDMVERAVYLLEWMGENRHLLMIPTIVLAEVLAPEPIEKYAVIMDRIKKSIIIPEFDLRAANVYANMFRNKIEALKKKAAENDVDNQKMKCDHLIIATAVANGANCIYPNDRGIHTFGQKWIDVKELPQLPAKPLTLFNEVAI